MISRIQCFADVYLSWRMWRSVAPVNAVDIECFEARHTAATSAAEFGLPRYPCGAEIVVPTLRYCIASGRCTVLRGDIVKTGRSFTTSRAD